MRSHFVSKCVSYIELCAPRICVFICALPQFTMWPHGVVVLLWRFLGAQCIVSDVQLALQTNAAARQFYNWMHLMLTGTQTWAHVRLSPRARRLAHPRLTARLRGALELLVLREACQSLRRQCDLVLDLAHVRVQDLLIASRDTEDFRIYEPGITRPYSAHGRPWGISVGMFGYTWRGWQPVFAEDEDAELQTLHVCGQKVCDLQTRLARKLFAYELEEASDGPYGRSVRVWNVDRGLGSDA